jgi:tRNA pseudouridine55 synthase
VDGVILVDKPAGKTSHDVVYAVRRQIGKGVKVGHAGTLDPFATGLLLVLVGRATRVQRWFMGLPKRYRTTAKLGYTSTTGDPEGVVEPGRTPSIDALPTGLVMQRPPAYSAVRIDGRRAYKLAREGQEVELPEREVLVSRFELVERHGDEATFVIECSSGTYVRSLIADLADAYCLTLRREAIGHFEVADADPERIVPLDEALDFLPAVELAGEAAIKASHGVAVPGPAPYDTVRLRDGTGLIALAEPREDGTLKPVVGFRG